MLQLLLKRRSRRASKCVGDLHRLWTSHRLAAFANTRLADIPVRGRVAIIAGRSIGFDRVGTDAGGWNAGSCIVTLIKGGARYGAVACANTGLADVALRAGVAVIAGCAIHFERIGAGAGVGVKGASVVTLVERGANHQGACANTGPIADIILRCRIAVITARASHCCGIGADAGGRVASSSIVALIDGRARHGAAARTNT